MNHIKQIPPEGYYQLPPPPGIFLPIPSRGERGPPEGLLESHPEEEMDCHRLFLNRSDRDDGGDIYDEAHLSGNGNHPDQ